jgi:hypothetical protein
MAEMRKMGSEPAKRGRKPAFLAYWVIRRQHYLFKGKKVKTFRIGWEKMVRELQDGMNCSNNVDHPGCKEA